MTDVHPLLHTGRKSWATKQLRHNRKLRVSFVQQTSTVTGGAASRETGNTSTSTTNFGSSQLPISSQQLSGPSPTAKTTSPTVHPPLFVPPKILGVIIAGGVGTVALLCFIVIWYRKRRAKERKKIAVTPFEPPLVYGHSDGSTPVEETHPPEYASQAGVLDIDIGTGSRASRGTELWTREKD